MSARRFIIMVCAAVVSLAALAVVAQERGASPRPGEIEAASDAREPIELSDVERAFIRREMRGLLGSVQEILEAAAEGDAARVAAAGRRAGMNGPEADHIPKSLAGKLPMQFKMLGLSTHRGFDQIAADAERSKSVTRAPKQVGELMRNCTACHGTWRITAGNSR